MLQPYILEIYQSCQRHSWLLSAPTSQQQDPKTSTNLKRPPLREGPNYVSHQVISFHIKGHFLNETLPFDLQRNMSCALLPCTLLGTGIWRRRGGSSVRTQRSKQQIHTEAPRTQKYSKWWALARSHESFRIFLFWKWHMKIGSVLNREWVAPKQQKISTPQVRLTSPLQFLWCQINLTNLHQLSCNICQIFTNFHQNFMNFLKIHEHFHWVHWPSNRSMILKSYVIL